MLAIVIHIARICRHLIDKLSNICQVCSYFSHLSLPGFISLNAFLIFALLQASVSKLEQQLADCESALVKETVVSQEKKHEAERAQYQVTDTCSLIFLCALLFIFFRAPAWKITFFFQQIGWHIYT